MFTPPQNKACGSSKHLFLDDSSDTLLLGGYPVPANNIGKCALMLQRSFSHSLLLVECYVFSRQFPTSIKRPSSTMPQSIIPSSSLSISPVEESGVFQSPAHSHFNQRATLDLQITLTSKSCLLSLITYGCTYFVLDSAIF